MPVVVEAGRTRSTRRRCCELSDAVRQKLGDAAVVLGSADDGRVHLVANVAPAAGRARREGRRRGARRRPQVAGGGGGGRDTMAQAGGRDPEKLPDALATARAAIEKALGSDARSLRSTTGRPAAAARSRDPSGTLATPLARGGAAGHASAASRRSRGSSRSRARSACVVGLPLTLTGDEGPPGG